VAKGAAGAGAGAEETFEDIQARTGATEEDILGRKMAFRKGMKPEKKIEEMVPMIKELRCVPALCCMLHAMQTA
jgi:hypothetical protein